MRSEAESPGRNVIIYALGTGEYSTANYKLAVAPPEAKPYTTEFSSLAVGNIAFGADCGVHVLCLVTEGARAYKDGAKLNRLSALVAESGWTFQDICIENGSAESEVWDIFSRIGDSLRDHDDVVADCTHGLRHLPLIMASALQYFIITRNLKRVRMYYGALELTSTTADGSTPVLDLTPLVALADWTYGTKIFNEYQLTRPLAQQLGKFDISGNSRGFSIEDLRQVGGALANLEPLLRYSLPLEAGISAGKLLQRSRPLALHMEDIPPMRAPWAQLESQLQDLQVTSESCSSQRGDSMSKESIVLSEQELDRQARIIFDYFSNGNVWAAFALMREWIVSAVTLHQGRGTDWLRDSGRDPSEEFLTRIASMEYQGTLASGSDTEKQLSLVWQNVRTIRNYFAHCGMGPGDVTPKALRTRSRKLQEQFGALYQLMKQTGYLRVEARVEGSEWTM